MQIQPIFDQMNNDLIRNQAALFRNLIRFQP